MGSTEESRARSRQRATLRVRGRKTRRRRASAPRARTWGDEALQKSCRNRGRERGIPGGQAGLSMRTVESGRQRRRTHSKRVPSSFRSIRRRISPNSAPSSPYTSGAFRPILSRTAWCQFGAGPPALSSENPASSDSARGTPSQIAKGGQRRRHRTKLTIRPLPQPPPRLASRSTSTPRARATS